MWHLLRKFFGKRSARFTYPLDIKDAESGRALNEYIPKERRYRVGPFYCDTSPNTHTGAYAHAIDFAVRDGALVYATCSGTITDIVEHNSEYGEGAEYADKLNYVTIDHGDCYSQYAHLKKGSVSAHGLYVGKHVMRAQVIGVVGKTGWVDFGENGDHLHFMVFTGTGENMQSKPVTFK